MMNIAELNARTTNVTPAAKVIVNDDDHFDALVAIGVDNELVDDVYLVNEYGTAAVAPGTHRPYLSYGPKELKITFRRRSGRAYQALTTNQHYFAKPESMPSEVQTITVQEERLRYGPIFLPGLGVVCCLEQHLRDATYNHPASQRFHDAECARIMSGKMSNGVLPVAITTNLANWPRDTLFVVINDAICSVPVTCTGAENSGVRIVVNDGILEREQLLTPEQLTLDGVFTAVIDGHVWYMSFNRAVLAADLAKRKQQINEAKTPIEVSEMIARATAELQTNLQEREKEIERLKRELSGTKKDLDLTSTDLTRANAEDDRSFAQESLRIKREAQRLATEQEQLKALQQTRQLDLERELAQARLTKERYSAQSAEVTSGATIAKAVAASIPVVLGIAMLVRSPGTSKATGAIFGAAVKKVTATLGCAVTTAVVRGVRKVGQMCWQGAKSIATHALNTISAAAKSVVSGAKRFWDWLWD